MKTDLTTRLADLERQVQKLSEQVGRIAHETAHLDQLRDDIGRLKVELEEMVEAGR